MGVRFGLAAMLVKKISVLVDQTLNINEECDTFPKMGRDILRYTDRNPLREMGRLEI